MPSPDGLTTRCPLAVLKQTKIAMKIRVAAVPFGKDVYPTIEPPLDADHAVGRLIFVPREVWPDLEGDDVGYIGKIMKCDKRTKVTTIKFHDAVQTFQLCTIMDVAPFDARPVKGE